VLKENGGQTSALNAGFEHACGEVVVFLDADDLLAPRAIERVAAALTDDVAKVHWPLSVVDAHGRATGALKPAEPLGRGDLREALLRDGPACYESPPTSGNAWSRRFLEAVLPLPVFEPPFMDGSSSADAYLSAVAPLYGRVECIDEPQSSYRVHGSNDYAGRFGFEEKLRCDLWYFGDRCDYLATQCERLGLGAAPERWKSRAWQWRFLRAREIIETTVPHGGAVVLVDGGELGPVVAPGRRTRPLIERDGEDFGAPADGATALAELERARSAGAGHFVIAWPAFWWLDHYTELSGALRDHFPLVWADENVRVHCLTEAAT